MIRRSCLLAARSTTARHALLSHFETHRTKSVISVSIRVSLYYAKGHFLVKILNFSIEIVPFSIEILSFFIEIMSFSIEILVFFIEILSFSIEISGFFIKILVFSIEMLSFSIEIMSFFIEKETFSRVFLNLVLAVLLEKAELTGA